MKKKPPPRGKRKSPAKASSNASALVPYDQVRALIDLLEERGLDEFELEREGLRVRIRRRGPAAPGPLTPPPVFREYAPAGANNPALAEASPAADADLDVGADVHIIKSPIVGTFYAAPRPDAPPFVQLGDGAKVGQVLCIIEAMKLMNEIESDVAGEVVRVYVENGQPVEYGAPLFAILPLKKK